MLEVALDVDVNYPITFAVACFPNSVERLFRASLWPKSVGGFLEIRFKDWFIHQFRCHLYYAVPNGGNPERSLLPVFPWDVMSSNRLRVVLTFLEYSLAFMDKEMFSLLFDFCKCFSINSRRAFVGFAFNWIDMNPFCSTIKAVSTPLQ